MRAFDLRKEARRVKLRASALAPTASLPDDTLVPRPRRIAAGIELFAVRTPTLPPATHTNCYALGTGEVLIVEPAPADPAEQRAFADWVRGIQSKGRKPLAIVATHHHGDHAGGAQMLAAELGLPLWAHAATAERLPRANVERFLQDGEELVLAGPAPQRWTVLHTPGHAPGHVCLHEARDGVVVLGDMIASRGTILIAPDDGDMATYLAQLRRLAGLEARLGLAAHGEPITSPSVVLRATHDHRLMRERKVLAAVADAAAAGATMEQLLERVYDDTPVLLWPLAMLSLQSHLAKLVDEARVRSSQGRWRLTARAG